MATDVKLPRLGQGMESGTIVKWLKAEGDRVEKGEPLFEVDTDKATQEVEAQASGVLLAISVASGEVPVGQTIAVIGEPGEKVPAAAEAKSAAVEPTESEPAPGPRETPATGPARRTESAAPAAPTPAAPTSHFRAAVNGARETVAGERIKASPLARRIARERGIELEALTGTGPEGRIIAEDVERAESAPATAPAPAVEAPEGAESVPLTKIRRTIARRLTEAWQVPAFQLTVSVDMTNANALIARSRELSPDVRVTVTDLLARVCARALVRHPDVNVQFAGDALHRFPSANIGIAVAAPHGLVVPVVHGADRLSLAEIAQRRGELVERARDASLKRDDLDGGTFTISNLGMFGVEQFSAVLNPPQATILAVGATVDRPVVHDGAVVVRPMMTVTLTVDHRAVDGAPAADFLRTVKTFLEDPALAL
ncbi:MAG TPA: dihydrolipoamide acetyltransferase family protein [Gaiellaceae bacterium]|jgi:pyruvate dehydrogenase E2 component (dihydrolipoamide acetyltransferase)